MIACPHCSRANPAQAAFCHHDGSPLGSRRRVAPGHFSSPFVFPSGRSCRSFDELAQACLHEWPAAVSALKFGALANFLYQIGRRDLAERAREVALYPDADWGLAQLLDRLPTTSMPDAKLLAPNQLNLGQLRSGQEGAVQLKLLNTAGGYLHGTITSDVPWLAVSRPRFGCRGECTIELRIVGRHLRASLTPLVARLQIATSGGSTEVSVRAEVPPIVFAAGVLAGARTPRQLVEKAKSNPQEASRLFESGAVARWYENNGWTYPIRESAEGSAINRFFAALGLPAVRIEDRTPVPEVSDPSQPWFAQSPAPPATNGDSSDWKPIQRSRRATPPPPPVSIQLTPVSSTPSRSHVWLLVLLPLLILGSAGLLAGGILLRSAFTVRQQPSPVVNIPPIVEPPIVVPPKDKGTPQQVTLLPPPIVEDDPPLPVRPPQPPPLMVPEFTSRAVEVVFCLDTTGSMGSLLRGAQQKIWAICNQIAGGRPTPSLRVGLVAYRDRGEQYVTKITDLTRDLDSVHQELLALKAAGGGDFAESVNEALDRAVNKITWSKDDHTLKIIFLVGDAPPHMDYKDDVKYPDTCKKAKERGILINAVQCGGDKKCMDAWKDIAGKSDGEYVAIPQTGGVSVINTPFDDRMAVLIGELMDTAMIYGDARKKKSGQRMIELAKVLRGASAADRAAFAAKSKRLGPNDLLDDLTTKRVKLDDIKSEELPEALQKLDSLDERQAYIKKIAAKRDELHTEALELEKKRAAYLEKQKAAEKGKDSFDGEVLKLLRKQAKKFAVEY